MSQPYFPQNGIAKRVAQTLGSPQALRKEPPLDPPDDPEADECLECGGPMAVIEKGKSGRYYWYQAKCEDCGNSVSRDNFE